MSNKWIEKKEKSYAQKTLNSQAPLFLLSLMGVEVLAGCFLLSKGSNPVSLPIPTSIRQEVKIKDAQDKFIDKINKSKESKLKESHLENLQPKKEKVITSSEYTDDTLKDTALTF